MRWIPLVLIFIGVFAIIKAVLMDRTSSFDDGSFIVQGMVGIVGGVCVVAAIIAFLVQWAMS